MIVFFATANTILSKTERKGRKKRDGTRERREGRESQREKEPISSSEELEASSHTITYQWGAKTENTREPETAQYNLMLTR